MFRNRMYRQIHKQAIKVLIRFIIPESNQNQIKPQSIMRRIISTQALLLNRSPLGAPLQIKSLLAKPMYFRSDKFRKMEKQRSEIKQNPAQNTSFQQPKVKISQPRQLLNSFKKGKINTIPLYLKYFQRNQNLQSQEKQKSKIRRLSSWAYAEKLSKMYKLSRSTKLSSEDQYNALIRLFSVVVSTVLFLLLSPLIKRLNPQEGHNEAEKQQLMSSQEVKHIVDKISEINFWKDGHDQSVRIKFKSSALKGDANEGIIKETLQNMGFTLKEDEIQFSSPASCPNLILAGLQKVQESKDPFEWVKSKIAFQKYTFTDAILDTVFLASPFISMALLYWIFTRSNPENLMSKFTHSKKSMKVQSMKDIKVRFKDVAGMEEAKKQITQFVDFLKKSQKYSEIGARIPKGALLTGPPGTGKTMLAKACAGQAGTSFFYVSGSEFVEMFVGLGAARVRQLFAKARLESPSIIFIDEIDAIGKKRQTSRNQEKDSTLNQLLVEMDGFSSSETVIVLAATNRKDTLDNALTRPGRFDRMVEVSLPQINARQQIFMVHLAPLKINPNKPLSEIAKRLSELTPGFSGADIANLCNEAAIIATRKKRNYIEDEDFEEASERIMAGYVKSGLSNVKSKKRVAYHEAGHAVCGWFLRGGDPLVKLTIIPRSKGALGYAQYLPKSAYIRTKDELIDQVSIMLGGTTSEQVFLGDMSSGNSDDLQKVYSLTRRMVAQFGMGQTTYNMTMDEQQYVRKQSEKLANTMDEQILKVVDQASVRAKNIIEEKKHIIEALAEELLKKQTINSEDILRIMGERPKFDEVAAVQAK